MFITDDFILYNDTARELYHEYAENMPIIDYHNHLNPQEISEDRMYENITSVWLGGDHYKWRAMRAQGYSEAMITGSAPDYDKFLAYADTVENCFGNPLYHWTHLELKRYFDIDETLNKETAQSIWERCNERLKDRDFSAQNLLRKQRVEVLCTTDDPADDLKWHKKIRETISDIKVYPSFRPGNVLDIEKNTFADYINKLGEVSDVKIKDIDDLVEALKRRLIFFIENGCRVTDHSLECDFFKGYNKDEANRIFTERMSLGKITPDDGAMYRGVILTELGKLYSDKDLVMQLHIGALRNNSVRMFKELGADTGFDSLSDMCYAPQLGALMNEMDRTDRLPKTILYCLNPRDMAMLMAMAGNYQGNEQGIRSRIQLGSAWWFNDHLHGMEEQLQVLSDMGLLSGFVGMLTDSRSFLSFPRHEYFRRILCNKIGEIVEKGQYPKNMEFLGSMVRNICYHNAAEYFRI